MGPKHFYSINPHGKNHIRPRGYSLIVVQVPGVHIIKDIFLKEAPELPLQHAYLARLQTLTTGAG